MLKSFIAPNARESSVFGGNRWLVDSPNLELIDLRSMRYIGRLVPERGLLFLGVESNPSAVLKVHQDCAYVPEDDGPDVNMMRLYNKGWTVELYDDDGNFVGLFNN